MIAIWKGEEFQIPVFPRVIIIIELLLRELKIGQPLIFNNFLEIEISFGANQSAVSSLDEQTNFNVRNVE